MLSEKFSRIAIIILLASTVLCAFGHKVYAVTLSDLFNTGVDDSHGVLPPDSPEQHWLLITDPISEDSAFVVTTHPNWASAPAGSAWISIFEGSADESDPDGTPPGFYDYILDFNLTGFDPNTAQISGDWTADNSSKLFLNDVLTPYASGLSDFSALQHFMLHEDFISGINSLRFRVFNGGVVNNPSGLVVGNLLGQAERFPDGNGAAIPEPSTLLLVGSVLLSTAFLKIRF